MSEENHNDLIDRQGQLYEKNCDVFFHTDLHFWSYLAALAVSSDALASSDSFRITDYFQPRSLLSILSANAPAEARAARRLGPDVGYSESEGKEL